MKSSSGRRVAFGMTWISHSFEVGIEHVNIPRSSPMEGEHTPIIIQLILSTDLAVIQLKDSHIFFIFPNTISL